jgi:hypothetical protein
MRALKLSCPTGLGRTAQRPKLLERRRLVGGNRLHALRVQLAQA